MIIWKSIKTVLRLLLKLPMTMKCRIIFLRWSGYKIGEKCTIGYNFNISDKRSDRHNIEIGNRVNIASNVTLVTTSYPNTSHLNKVYMLNYGKITIHDDCWIGTGAILLPGVTIGKCTIIGAGVVVEKDIPEYSAIKQKNIETIRFPESMIELISK